MLYHRQKVILSMLRAAKRPVGRLELMKWAFLLRMESESRGGSAFYGFIPYRYGPYSFALGRDMNGLVEKGLVSASDEKHWTLAPEAAFPSAESDAVKDVRRVVERFAGKSGPSSVMDYVYERYPAYTVHSERRKLAELPCAVPAVYTAGYEGLSVDEFLDLLVQSGIRRLIDVRRNPVARRYGFHKSTLSGLCSKLEIDYVHFPELGIASEHRQSLETQADRDRLFDLYEGTTLVQEPVALGKVAKLMTETASVLVCMEESFCTCHRSRVAKRISHMTGMTIQDLRG